MMRALVEDCSRLPGVWIDCLRDYRLPAQLAVTTPRTTIHNVRSAGEERELLSRLTRCNDWTIVIAPELEGHLLQRVQWIEQYGGRLLSPNSAFVALTSDKHATASYLEERKVAVPRGTVCHGGQMPPCCESFPAVIKRCDGAGSTQMQFVATPDDLPRALPAGIAWRIEQFCPGRPASVSVLCGQSGPILLPASWQLFSGADRFMYIGGETPLPAEFGRRAWRMARTACDALPPVTGYVGLDIVLGDCPDGSRDVVIEVNPRITTSYLGVRQIVENNLVEAMLRVASGRPVELSFAARTVRFLVEDFFFPPKDEVQGSEART